jgi:phosphohistidine phosphatase SixA
MGGEDKYSTLSSQGKREAAERGRDLFNRGINPEVYFTSWFVHAKQTANILQKTVGDLHKDRRDSHLNPKVVELCALTPQFPGPENWAGPQEWAGIKILEWIRSEALYTGNNLRTLEVVVFVLHTPRIMQLLAGMKRGKALRPEFDFSEGICLTAESFDEFLERRGKPDGLPMRRNGTGGSQNN